ncbi:hypothetical protein J6S88_00460 [bacterium]|nr:hypothetical protein [bacterium]
MKRVLFLLLGVVLLGLNQAYAANKVWINDLRTAFLNNSAIIMEVNMRSFAALDTDGDGLIMKSQGEESGNFLNAIERIKVMPSYGINTLLLMPINEVGKVKALGTAGSLYAVSDFSKLNHQLVSDKSILSANDQAKKFIEAAHENDIRIIVDLPPCGAYDLYLKRPELFLKDKNGDAQQAGEWTDVKMFNAGTEEAYNRELYEVYKSFVDLMLELGVDGVRASEPELKPASFWKDLISYSRKMDPQFLWIAQVEDNQKLVKISPVNTSKEALLNAGFDGYYGFFEEFKNITSANEFTTKLSNYISSIRKGNEPKAVMGVFDSHDDESVLLNQGADFCIMEYWLGATLPVNSYILDGNQNGANFIYPWGNKVAKESDTDDNRYFVQRGKMDIYNYSPVPYGNNEILINEYVMSNMLKKYLVKHLNLGTFHVLKTNNPSVFAYAISYNRNTLIVIGNLNKSGYAKGEVKIKKINPDLIIMPVRITGAPIIGKNKINVDLSASEIQILMINDFEI